MDIERHMAKGSITAIRASEFFIMYCLLLASIHAPWYLSAVLFVVYGLRARSFEKLDKRLSEEVDATLYAEMHMDEIVREGLKKTAEESAERERLGKDDTLQ
ncbi:hypothetical protein LP416_02110 [Polaromonas sp. P2-4]|nr:hypothetical protein LP416_02110 [Polaromonas sp. P2-4]